MIFKFPYIINVQCNKYTQVYDDFSYSVLSTHTDTHITAVIPIVSSKLFAVVLDTNSMQSSHSCEHFFHFNDSNLSSNRNSWLEKHTYICSYRSLGVCGWVRALCVVQTHTQWKMSTIIRKKTKSKTSESKEKEWENEVCAETIKDTSG